MAARQPAAAEKIVRSALGEIARSRRSRLTDTSILHDALVEILESTDRIDEAVAVRRQLATEAAKRHGPDHPQSQATATSLALAMAAAATARGDHAEAVRLYAILVDGYTRSLGADHPKTIATQAKLAAARQAAGQPPGKAPAP